MGTFGFLWSSFKIFSRSVSLFHGHLSVFFLTGISRAFFLNFHGQKKFQGEKNTGSTGVVCPLKQMRIVIDNSKLNPKKSKIRSILTGNRVIFYPTQTSPKIPKNI